MNTDPVKMQAHRAVRQEVVMGRMVRPETCSKCGATPGLGADGRPLIQGHHHKGYDRPLDVEWLCVQCHRDETPINPLRGEEAVTAKLTEEQVRDIRTRRMSDRRFSILFGVTKSAVQQARTGITWKHLALFPRPEDEGAGA